MVPALVLAGVAATAFVSTNVDAFLLLVANSARAPASRNATAAAFVAATVLVLAGAWALAAASSVVPPSRIGLCGVVPLLMGARQVVDLVRRRAPRDPVEGTPSSRPPADTVRFGEALVLHLSISVDNLAVYAALLSDTLPPLRASIAATTLTLSLVWTALARAALRIPGLAPVLLRRGRVLMAVLLVVVGVYILLDTDTDVLR
jgi:cadmium resistance protein CadD (predicted permease)